MPSSHEPDKAPGPKTSIRRRGIADSTDPLWRRQANGPLRAIARYLFIIWFMRARTLARRRSRRRSSLGFSKNSRRRSSFLTPLYSTNLRKRRTASWTDSLSRKRNLTTQKLPSNTPCLAGETANLHQCGGTFPQTHLRRSFWLNLNRTEHHIFYNKSLQAAETAETEQNSAR